MAKISSLFPILSAYAVHRETTRSVTDGEEEDEPPSCWFDSLIKRGDGRRRRFTRKSVRNCCGMMSLICLALAPTLCLARDPIAVRGASETSLGLIGGETSVEMGSISTHEYDASDMLDDCSLECCLSLPNIFTNLRGQTRWLQTASTNATDPCAAPQESSGISLAPWLQYLFIILLLLLSAMFSGLTLGLMSLDLSGLEIVMATEDPLMARAARTIYPVRKNGNFLLCTLLLGNVAVNSLLSILMADITGGLLGFLVSTFAIVIFGEIIPQAVCSRFPLQVGEKAVPLVKFFMVLLALVAYPLAFVLNKALGRELGTTYSQSEMAKLIELHVQGGHFDHETGAAMTGALRYHGMSVKDAMTDLKHTFMLGADERLGFDTVAKIFKTGYSRIPVYEVTKSNVIGLLFVKDLIFLDPEDEIPVKNFVQIFGRGLHIVWPEDKLGNVLKLLKKGRSHMALVRDVNHGDGTLDPFYEIKGIITLEDIIEIILGDEIVDETDEVVDVNDPASRRQHSDMGEFIGSCYINVDEESSTNEPQGHGSRASKMSSADWESRLRLLDERLVGEHLSPDEVRAVAAHLKTNYSKAVELISEKQLKGLLSSATVTELPPAHTCASGDDDNDECNWVPTDRSELLYERGVAADFCTVVLTGKLAVMSGADKFRSDVSNWGVLGTKALTDPSYVPDFSAWVVPMPHDTSGCRCIKLDRSSFFHAVDNTALEKTSHATITEHTAAQLLNQDQSQNGGQKSHGSPPPSPGRVHPLGTLKSLEESAELDMSGAVKLSHPSYIQPQEQKVTRDRRSKLLNAFMHAKEKESSGG